MPDSRSLTYVGPGGDDEQRAVGRSLIEPGQRGCPGLRAGAASQHDWVQVVIAQQGVERHQVVDPLRENEAVTTTRVGGDDVLHYLLVATGVGYEVFVDRGDYAGLGRVGVAEVSVVGRVNVQYRLGPRCVQASGR